MPKQEKSALKKAIEEFGIKDLKDVHEFVKMITAETIQQYKHVNGMFTIIPEEASLK